MSQEPGIKNFRVAVASSGLGHIARGVETWARDTADALHERGVAVALFSGAPLPASPLAPRVAVPCMRRFSLLSRLVVRLMPGFAWRWGLKSGYGLEQWTFWRHLEPLLREGGFDIMHVQDPMVAYWCRRARLAGRIATKEILAHGTEEPAAFLSKFEYVQHLLSYHLEQVLSELGWEKAPAGWCVAPNFVDTERFVLEKSISQRRRVRRVLGIPEDAFVVGSAGAIKKHHKRMDYLIREFASFSSNIQTADFRLQTADCRLQTAHWGKSEIGNQKSEMAHSSLRRPYLVIAGARESETDEVMRLGRELLGDRVTFLVNHPFEQMPDFYKALDVFVLPSLFEMMGIVFAEAMASGVPAIGHEHPVMREVIGEGGCCVDMAREGALAEALGKVESLSLMARRQVEKVFSKDVVIQKYIEYYGRVLRDG